MVAVGFVSAATLAYEILLVRIFAIEHFHHFAYMAIGVAMLGFGASGTLLALLGRVQRESADLWLALSTGLTCLALVVSPVLVHQIALDPTQLPWDPQQWVRLAGVYVLLALPFFTGALVILLALTQERGRPGTVYGVSFGGSGLGAALALGVLWFFLPERALAVPAVLAAFGAVAVAAAGGTGGMGRPGWQKGFLLLSALAAALMLIRPAWRLHVTPYKGLTQIEAYPDARRVAERSNPVGWVVAVDAPAFRFAPGLSLAFSRDFPTATALFVDGGLVGAAANWASDTAALAILDWLPTAAPYAVREPRSVLIIGAAGGTGVWNAVTHGATRVTALEINADLVELASTPTRDLQRSDVALQWVVGDARSYVARSRDEFDVITLAPTGGPGTSAAGVHSLNQDFLNTVEAYTQYLGRLSGNGVLSVTRWIAIPPRENVRVILTAAEALRRTAGDVLERGLVVLRSWGTATVMVKPSGFSRSEIQHLREWAHERLFDLDWYPGVESAAAQFNYLAEPTLYKAAAAAVSGTEDTQAFTSTYPFDVAPVHDARPYPHHFLRLSSLPALVRAGVGEWLPFAEWGPIALVATLVQSVVLAALLMLLPVAIRARQQQHRPPVRTLGYFAAIGLAYLAAEMAAIQQLGLLLGHPVYAVAIVLTVFLILSGAGSVWSDRLEPATGRPTLFLLALTLAVYAVLLLAIVHAFQGAHLFARGAVAALALAPPAFLMGMPFPLGLRRLTGENKVHFAWAWATNGFASVVAAPLAALVALGAGSRVLFLVAAAAYGAAAVLGRTSTS